MQQPPLPVIVTVFLSLLLEVFFADSAGRTDPILRKIFKCGSGSNSALRIALCRVIDVPADNANISIHKTSEFQPREFQFPDHNPIRLHLQECIKLQNC